jgi:ABC-2 type transport system permease protein
MNTPLVFLKRDFLIQTSYRAGFAVQILGIFVAVPGFYFLSKVFNGATSDVMDRYGGNYFAFLLLGIAFVDYLALSLKTFNESLRESQLMGTFEIVLLAPVRLWEVLIYSSTWGYIFTTMRFAAYIGCGMLFGLNLDAANVGSAIVVLSVSIVAFAALGMLIASVTVVIKRGEGLVTMASVLSSLLGGIIYPIEVMPHWMQTLAKFLPITHALEAMRLALLRSATITELLPSIAILLLFSAVLMPIALLAFGYAVQWGKISGTLSQY